MIRLELSCPGRRPRHPALSDSPAWRRETRVWLRDPEGGLWERQGRVARRIEPLPPPDWPAPPGALLVMLDERGEQPTSPDFAARLARHRDEARDICFLIGGADGLDPALRARADWQISFGRMVWPHMLVRVMLAEQLYRAATILAGSPYHRA